MQQQNKILIVQIIILAVIIVFFFISKDSGTDNFKQAFKEANLRLDSIQMEITKSTDLIKKTKIQLDSIQRKVNVVKQGQTGSNDRVEDIDAELRRKIRTQEATIKSITLKYEQSKKEREILSRSLDSLANQIKNNY
jgi:chromosome segregation ATPase